MQSVQTKLRRPNGYWKDWENVEREITKLIEKLGHFPTQQYMRENAMSSLY